MEKKKIESYYIVKVGKMFVTNKSVAGGNLSLSSYASNASRWNLVLVPKNDADIGYNNEIEKELIRLLRGIQDLGVSDVKVLHREEYFEEHEAEYGIVVNMQGLKLGLVKR